VSPSTTQSNDRSAGDPAHSDLSDMIIDVKVVLSGLWVTMLMVFAYVDIFGFWRRDVIEGVIAGKIPGAGFEIDQGFLVFTTVYVLIPSLMCGQSLIVSWGRRYRPWP
jgi:hypothetical protein